MSADALVRDLAAFSVQVALIACAVGICLAVLKVPPRARYACLRMALVACLVAPWLIGPRDRAVEPASRAQAASTAAVRSISAEGTVPANMPPVARAATAGETPLFRPAAAIFAAIALGIALRGLWLAGGLIRLRRLVRRSVPIESADFAAIQHELGTSARIAHAARLTQPVTFGVRRPIVLLPETLTAAPLPLQRAVVTHELFHVRRGDWLSVIAEELLRTVLWFHPAVFWLTSRIQLAREEIVDELSVHATGDRRTYIEALLSFADTPGLGGAPAFAQRRHLFHRIVAVSKENVMTVRQVVASAVIVVTVLAGASMYASTAFPVVAARHVATLSFGAEDSSTAERVLSRSEAPTAGEPRPETAALSIATGSSQVAQAPSAQAAGAAASKPVTPENPIPRRIRGASPQSPPQFAGQSLSVVVSTRVTIDRNGAVTDVVQDACNVSTADTNGTCAAFFDASAAAIRQWRYDRPAQGPLQFYVTVSFRPGADPEVTQTGSASISREAWLAYVRETQDSLRVLAEAARGPEAANVNDADLFLQAQITELERALRETARRRELLQRFAPASPDNLALQRQLEMGLTRLEQARAELTQSNASTQAAPSSQSRAPIAPSGRLVYTKDTPGLTLPRPLQRVPAAYTRAAMEARVEGTVVIEAVVDEQGRVADAKVLQSVPLLDEAALANVKQWVFSPGLLNGTPVNVFVQIELDYTLR